MTSRDRRSPARASTLNSVISVAASFCGKLWPKLSAISGTVALQPAGLGLALHLVKVDFFADTVSTPI